MFGVLIHGLVKYATKSKMKKKKKI